jgi:ribulose-phosphate 3-epimerase
VKVSPSIISAKLEDLGSEIAKCVEGGATSFHLDVMDGHFVPNLTMGPDLVKAVRRCTDLDLEAHLMLQNPEKYYRKFIDAGASIPLIHVESPINTGLLLKKIRNEGNMFGIVINPETSLEKALPFLEDASLLLIMSVHPGFSGQKFIEDAVDKIREARSYIDGHKLETSIEVDGGITLETAKICRDAGADIVVSASYIFSGEVAEKVRLLTRL